MGQHLGSDSICGRNFRISPKLAQQLDEINILMNDTKSKRNKSPPIFGIWICTMLQEQPGHLHCGLVTTKLNAIVKGSGTCNVMNLDLRAQLQQLLKAGQVLPLCAFKNLVSL